MEGLFRDFYELWPQKFNNKTNGVTPRRWIAEANPGMTELISEQIGNNWIADLSQLDKLKPFAAKTHANFHARWRDVKFSNKQRLADLVKQECGVDFNPNAMFDIQVKRIHEYKRQLLNILHVIHLYRRIKLGRLDNWADRCVLIGGKAAPGYVMAKRIIKLINSVAEVVNTDPEVNGRLKVAFLPNYCVSSMEIIAPAADLSEQISTAGKEASGTGNMKFALNGALTIGTLDGANVEILEHVGADNIKIFGMTAQEVEDLRVRGYNPRATIESIPALKDVLDAVAGGVFSPNDQHRYSGLVDSMYNSDHFLVAPDFVSYAQAQRELDTLWLNQDQWQKKAVLNTANMGWFSSDRTIAEYAREI